MHLCFRLPQQSAPMQSSSCVHVDFMLTADHLCASDFFQCYASFTMESNFIPILSLCASSVLSYELTHRLKGCWEVSEWATSSPLLCEQCVGLGTELFLSFFTSQEGCPGGQCREQEAEAQSLGREVPGRDMAAHSPHPCLASTVHGAVEVT